MHIPEPESPLRFDDEATQILRQVANAAAGAAAGVRDLLTALADPSREAFGLTNLHKEKALKDLLDDARVLAAQRGADMVSLDDVRAALAAVDAVALGLDLGRLRFWRWQANRLYGSARSWRETGDSHRMPTGASAKGDMI
jgi:hypothetical protein